MHNKINYFSENKGLALIITLLLLNYGTIWTRGGYADDFVFLAYVEGKDLYSGITQWPFNSRLSQAFLLPFLFKTLSGEITGEFHWWILHSISLTCLIIITLFFNKILKQLEAPWVMRFTAVLFFILYPIKNTTIMWPATIIGYVIPLTLFLFGAYIYLTKAKLNSENFLSLSSTWVLFLISIFCIEQLFPLVVLTIFLRLYLWRAKLSIITTHLAGAFSLAALFVSVNFIGKTADRTSHHSIPRNSLIEHALDVSVQSFGHFIKLPFKILFDPYYRADILIAGENITLYLSALVLIALGIHFIKHNRINAASANKTILFIIGGLVFWFAALSPLMVVDYYIPDRVLFIPLLGFSVVVGAIAYLLDKHIYFFRYLFFSLLILCGSAFSLVNIYTHNNFTDKWLNEQTLIASLIVHKKDFKEKATINLFNFPSNKGPSPNLNDNFTFNGMVNWLYPDKKLKGETLGNFTKIFQLPKKYPDNNQNNTYYPNASHAVLLWTGKSNKIISIKELYLENTIDINNTKQNHINNKEIVKGTLTPINKNLKLKKYAIKIPYLISITKYDIGIFNISLDYKNILKKHRLYIHVNYMNGSTIPLDKWVSLSSSSWSSSNSTLSTDIFLNNISTIKSINIFSELDKNNKLLIPSPL